LIVLILGNNKTASPTFLVINFPLRLPSLILFSLKIFCSKLCFQNP
jgi:hypothetical protein